MKLLSGLVIAAAGQAIMLWAYFGYTRLDPAAPCSSGVIYVGDRLRGELPRPMEFRHLPTTVRPLPADQISDAVLQAMAAQGETRRRKLALQLCEKMLLLDPQEAGISEEHLASGRMPRPGNEEVLAGYQATVQDQLRIDGHDFTVVGVLRRDVVLLADCYIVPPHPSVTRLFRPSGTIHPAVLVALTGAELRDEVVRDRLKEIFPREQFTGVAATVRADRGPYYLYLAGEGLLLLGGSVALIALYGALARWIGWSVLRDPLGELAWRPKLLGTVHLVYFGLVMAASVIVFELPVVQMAMLSVTRQALTDPNNPLGVAAEAYRSQNILWAAAVTFAINFFIGSLAVITVPSLIVPGGSVPVPLLRATLWGFLLAPAFVVISLGMLPHSGTLLLEGEGYILATFFGLLVPIYMFDPGKGAGVLERYGRAALMNLKAMVVVAIVLGIAACYEATEVILMNR
jgi:hypothetical protein